MHLITSSPVSIMMLFFGIGGAIAFIVSVIMSVRYMVKLRQLSEQHTEELLLQDIINSRLNVMLRSEPLLLFVTGNDEPVVCEIALIDEYKYLEEETEPYNTFLGSLNPDDATLLKSKISELGRSGLGFDFSVVNVDGMALEITGRAAGTIASIRVRKSPKANDELVEANKTANKYKFYAEAFAGLLDSDNVIAWMRNPSGKLTWVSRGYANAVEADDPSKAIDDQVELLNASDRMALRDIVNNTGECRTQVYAIIGGNRVCIELKAVKLKDGSSCVISNDISEIDELAKKLTEHAGAYNQTLNAVVHPIAIFSADQKLEFANIAYQEFWGLEDSFLTSNPTDSQILDQLKADRKIPSRRNYSEWKDKHLEIYSKLSPQEEWWELPDGRTIRVYSRPHPFGGVIYLYEDQTENVKLRNDYHEVLMVQRESLDNLTESVALFGSNGCLKLHNRAFCDLWEVDPLQLKGNPHIRDVGEWCGLNIVNSDHWKSVVASITDLGEHNRSLNVRISTKLGPVIEVRSLRLADGDTLVTFMDVTDTVQIENALETSNSALNEAQRLKVDFMTRVSKKFRTPLNSVIGFTQMLKDIKSGTMNPRQYEYLNYIASSADELRTLVDDVIDIASMDAGLLKLNIQSVNLHDVFSSAVRALGPKIMEKRIRLYPDFAVDAMRIDADPDRLEQVFKHLISNSVAFSDEGEKIQYGTRLQDGKIIAWVQDFGCGIDPELKDVIIDRFNGNPVNPNHRGAGLGLALVKQFMVAHGGSVHVESELNRGTCVECRFSRAVEDIDPLLLTDNATNNNGEKKLTDAG